ncbi:uncharacterized protein LOC132612904 [Lycium barbarum]|uniref:uncharacterized protein LOC132612904 n=1 Tax=Lycium barbarum TaxID=112863 RepID=UPI00293E6902|nr:uncharacterized protein LOC132612904 [Lycium barbarum]
MTRGKGRSSEGRVRKSSLRGDSARLANMPSIPIPTTISAQQGGTSSIGGPDPINHVQTLDKGTSNQSNTISEEESSSRRRQQTPIIATLTPAGLEPSKECSNTISASFKNQIDPNGINCKGVLEDTRDFYFGEFKTYYWDSSIPESVIRKHWNTKAATKYKNFISKIKQKRIKPHYVFDNVSERWLQLWVNPKCVEKSEINAKNRCGGKEVALGLTHVALSALGSIARDLWFLQFLILAVAKGRDPTPGEVHLHVYTHDPDGESFVDERARAVHERYQEILWEKSQSQSDIDQCEAYYEAARGTRKRRTYGLGSQAQSYYGPNLCARGVISSPSHHPNTPINKPSVVIPILPPPPTANVDDVDPLDSDDDRSPSPMH